MCYDSGAANNHQVAQAENTLARELTRRGAKPHICRIPALALSAKSGIDDYLVEKGVEKFSSEILCTAKLWSQAEALFKLNEEVIYVSNPGLILRLDTLQRMRARDFVDHAYSNRIYVEIQTTATGERKVDKSAPKEWLKWQYRAKVERTTYAPGQPRITDAGELNLWPGWAVTPQKGNVQRWHDFLDYLFIGSPPADRMWFEQWLAYQLQYPGEKLYTAVVMWSRKQGTAICLSISITNTQAELLNKRIRNYGDRSKVFQLLLQRFLSGEIDLTIPARKL